MNKIKDDLMRKRGVDAALKYLAIKRHEKEEREDQKMNDFTMFILGIAAALIVGIGSQLYILGAL